MTWLFLGSAVLNVFLFVRGEQLRAQVDAYVKRVRVIGR